MYGQGVKGHTHTAVPGPVAGKMSTPFCIGLYLKTGRVSIDSFTEETLTDKDILALSQLVRIEPDDEMTGWVPNKRAANATVTTKDGKKYFFQADYAPGEPELPMTIEDYKKKLHELAAPAKMTEAQVEELADMILTFNGKVADFMQKLA